MSDMMYDGLSLYLDRQRVSVPGLLEIAGCQPSWDSGRIRQLYQLIWPSGTFELDVEELTSRGYLAQRDGSYYIPGKIRTELERSLATLAETQLLPFAPGVTLGRLMEGFFEEYNQELGGSAVREEGWGRVMVEYRGKTHRFEVRFTPYPSQSIPNACRLLIGLWGKGVLSQLAPVAVADDWTRSVALYNLAYCQKMNVVPTGVFAYFDRYLRDSFGLRIAPCHQFTLQLINAGILRVEG